jgi:succinyl-CoA synthetase alpha subunit
MSIFIDETTSIIVQGITGKERSFWTKHMKDMGSAVVAGVTPGKERQEVEGIPAKRGSETQGRRHAFCAPKIHHGRGNGGP